MTGILVYICTIYIYVYIGAHVFPQQCRFDSSDLGAQTGVASTPRDGVVHP